jgi:hypothetical protein
MEHKDGNHWVKVTEDGNTWISQKNKRGDSVIRTINVGPTMAQRWLDERNTHNRKFKKREIDIIAHDITNDNYWDTANYISFYFDGILHDGQNRLAAIVKAGKVVRQKIAFGIMHQAGAVTDRSKPRTLGDRTRLAGYEFKTKTLQTAKFLMEQLTGTTCPYDDEIVGILEQYKDVFNNVSEAVHTRGYDKQPALSGIAFCMLEMPDQQDKIMQFADKFNSGVGLTESSPILRLRNFGGGVGLKCSNNGSWRIDLFLKTVWAVRQFVAGEKVDRLYAAKRDSIVLPNVHMVGK